MEIWIILAIVIGLAIARRRLFAAKRNLQARERELSEVQSRLKASEAEASALMQEVESLRPFAGVRDAAKEARQILDAANHQAQRTQLEATAALAAAKAESEQTAQALRREAREKREAIERDLAAAGAQAARIVDDAQMQAKDIAGEAWIALQDKDRVAAELVAIKNAIEGFGDRYLVPTHSLLDDLAEAYSFNEAGVELKAARERSRRMSAQGRAAACDYVEAQRKETAIRFVLDAFNGKADSILSRTKVDNFGTLQQEVRDAAVLVNKQGAAFRVARILPEYVDARIEELRWAVRMNAMREQEREEQRRIRERLREEERARREYERAMKDAAKEEELVLKALERAQPQLEQASAAQRQPFEDQIRELNVRLAEAEERNRRALSMAQQTRAGHVYVISNIGSFGEDVFKVGMTRRLEPLDRVRELGDASVPFAFDVHAMIWSDNAPTLETTLHRKLVQAQVNKVNPRKEFFRVGLQDIRKAVGELGLEAAWTLTAEAREFRETQAIERQLAADPSVRAAWVRQQMLAEAQDLDEEQGEDLAAAKEAAVAEVMGGK